MTQERLNELIATCERMKVQETYAKGIVATWRKAEEERHYLSDNYDNINCNEWLDRHAENEKLFKSVTMKVKHFFDMVYGKGNVFCINLKGRDCLEHYWAFEDYCRGLYPYILK